MLLLHDLKSLLFQTLHRHGSSAGTEPENTKAKEKDKENYKNEEKQKEKTKE